MMERGEWISTFKAEFARVVGVNLEEFDEFYSGELDNWLEDNEWENISPHEAVDVNMSYWGD